MRTVVVQNCTVELQLPDLLEMSGTDGPRKSPSVAITLTTKEHVEDVLVRMPDGKTIAVKKLWLRKILANMVPVVDQDGNAVLFAVSDTVQPDAVVSVGGG